ncbi:MAG: hypothetical protein, partial [Olavius algarvensis Gamma 1 endosymbiont]
HSQRQRASDHDVDPTPVHESVRARILLIAPVPETAQG